MRADRRSVDATPKRNASTGESELRVITDTTHGMSSEDYPGNEQRPFDARNVDPQNLDTCNIDACFKVLRSIQDQVRFADGKTSFLFGINALMFGYAAGAVGILKPALVQSIAHPSVIICLVSLTMFVALSAGAVITLISMVMSRFSGVVPAGHIFFGHVIKQHGIDHETYAQEVIAMTRQDWAKEICSQIVEISHIAMFKHRLVRRTAYLTQFAFLCWLVSVVASFFIPQAVT